MANENEKINLELNEMLGDANNTIGQLSNKVADYDRVVAENEAFKVKVASLEVELSEARSTIKSGGQKQNARSR